VEAMEPIARSPSRSLSRRVRVTGVVWLAMAGMDFLLNGAVFARIYSSGGGFLLQPVEAFRRIPLGYLAFLLLAAAIVEVASRLRITRAGDGLRLGLVTGAVFGGTWALGLYSIATVSALVALAFALIWLVLIALAWTIAVMGLARGSLRGLALEVVVVALLAVIVVIALQSFGVVPTVKA